MGCSCFMGDNLEMAKQLVMDLELAKLTRELMSRVRYKHESDANTLKRVIEEYDGCKYRGVPIPGSEKYAEKMNDE